MLILGALVLILFLFLGIGWGYLKYEQSQINMGELEKLQTARALWDQRSFTDYEMTVHYAYYLEEPCDRTLKYESEKDWVIIIKNDCLPIPDVQPYSVVVMFDTIEHWLTDEYKCGINGCECDGPIIVKGEYDATYGFPISFQAIPDEAQRWKYMKYWQNYIDGIFSSKTVVVCYLLGTSYPSFEITSFTPITP